jgi:hypothetical protein
MKSEKILRLCLLGVSLTPGFQVAAQDWAGVYVSKGCVPRVVSAQEHDYSSWIKPYAKRLRKAASRHKQDVALSLTVLDGDNLAPDPSETWVCGGYCCQMSTTYSVSSTGMVTMTRVTPMAVQGGGPSPLPADASQTIQELARSLLHHPPDDHARLPPPGRRLVLHVEGGNETVTRVYDRADIPSPVMEVLGLVGATTGPIWMDFKPHSKTMQDLGEPPISEGATGIRVPHHPDSVTKGLRAPTATLAISPDNSMIVTHYFFTNPRTMVTDRNGESSLIAVSDYEVDRRVISVLQAFFTPDSLYLLLLSNLPAIYIYDTKTWEPVNNLPGLPAGATAFYPSLDWKHGVAVLRGGEVGAWDITKNQKQSSLDLQGDLQYVSFSEDDSMFAVSSVHQNEDSSSNFRLRIWDTNTGQFLREMIPPYYFEHDVISKPMWWGHGKYLLANLRAGHWGGYTIAVWSVQSGQLRGGFSACDSSQDPFEVGIDGPRLLKWCFDETLLVWDVPAAMDKIIAFDESLANN